MKRQKSCGPRLGKLVHQLPGVVTFAYDLRFRRVIARWKGIIEEIHFGGSIMPLAIIENLYLKKKLHLGPQNGPGSENLLKIVNCQNGQKTVLSHLEKVGGPRYPPGSLAVKEIQPTKMKALGEKIEEASLVQKIMRSLPDRFNPKVSAIEELNDLKYLDFDQLLGTLNSYEMRIGKDKSNTR
jgi:hypothetical protein